MEELKVDWEQEKPTNQDVVQLWNSINILRIDKWTTSANTLTEKINFTHCNGGIQLHKYKIIGDKHFNWFACRNRLQEINFLDNILRHKNLQDYRNDLQISNDNPKIIIASYWTDIYDLSGQLARIMGHGGAYKKIDPELSWMVATDFVKDEFQNRFEEFVTFDVAIEKSNWFFDIAWDISKIFFDKRNNELLFIDITDTD
jgi:hypothetical protein